MLKTVILDLMNKKLFFIIIKKNSSYLKYKSFVTIVYSARMCSIY